MERRSFLATLIALVLGRKLPTPEPRPCDGLVEAELSLASGEDLLRAAGTDWLPSRFSSVVWVWSDAEQRYLARTPPDVWGEKGEVAFTITTTP